MKAADLIEKFKYALSDKWGYIWGTTGIMWTESRQKQKVKYMVSKYGENWLKNADAKNDTYYLAAKLGSKWIGHRVADCSGLFVWAFKELGGSIYHGSNSIYDRYCSSKGKITDAVRKSMKPGTAVFVDHSGNKSHIGLFIGNNTVIEAASTEAGVCTSKLNTSKWTYWGELKNVSYPAQNEPEQPSPAVDDKTPTGNLPTLRRGSTGEYVTLLQTMLKNKGYDLGKYGVDGDFGSATLAAVKAFQKANGLDPDGVVGKNTWTALQNSKEMQYYTVVVQHLTDSQADALVKMYDKAYKEPEKG